MYDVYLSRHGRWRLTNRRTQSKTHKNNTATDKAVDQNRKWYFAIVQKYDVGVGDVQQHTYCKSKKKTTVTLDMDCENILPMVNMSLNAVTMSTLAVTRRY